jgi:hypothetical protein
MKPIKENVDKDLLAQAIRFNGFCSETVSDDEMAFLLD